MENVYPICEEKMNFQEERKRPDELSFRQGGDYSTVTGVAAGASRVSSRMILMM